MTTLTQISNKLLELGDKYAIQYPKFYEAELLYNQLRAKTLMSQEVSALGSQGMREAECDRIMAQKQEFIEYHAIKPEIDVINRLTWIYTELAKNIRASQWEGKQE